MLSHANGRTMRRLSGSALTPSVNTASEPVFPSSLSYLNKPIITSGYTGGGARKRGGVGYGCQMEWIGTGYSILRGSLTYGDGRKPVPDKFIRLWPEYHFDLTDYHKRLSPWEIIQQFFKGFLPGFRVIYLISMRFLLTYFLVFGYQRGFEPKERFVMYDHFWKDWKSNLGGRVMDHHAYSHRLAKRRAIKYGYEEMVPDLFDPSKAHH